MILWKTELRRDQVDDSTVDKVGEEMTTVRSEDNHGNESWKPCWRMQTMMKNIYDNHGEE